MPLKRIVLATFVYFTLTANAAAAGSGNDADEIRRIDAQLVASLNAQDVDQWLSYFADDGEMWPPRLEVRRNRQHL